MRVNTGKGIIKNQNCRSVPAAASSMSSGCDEKASTSSCVSIPYLLNVPRYNEDARCKYNPHIHALVASAVFRADGSFVTVPLFQENVLRQFFEANVFKLFVC